jgi:hypothetical protein
MKKTKAEENFESSMETMLIARREVCEAKTSLAFNFPQTLPVRFFRLKANQRELLDPSAARLGLPSVENQPAWDWLARFLCRAH